MRIESVSSISSVPNVSVSDQSVQKSESEEGVSESRSVEISDRTEISTQSEAHEEFNDEMLKKAIEQANKSLSTYDRKIERSVHEVTKTIMYVIKDTKTNEVVSEFPPKKIQDMIAKMWELAGLFVDEKA